MSDTAIIEVLYRNKAQGKDFKFQKTLKDFIEYHEEDLWEEMNETESKCSCVISESSPFCDCGGDFEDYEYIGFEIDEIEQLQTENKELKDVLKRVLKDIDCIHNRQRLLNRDNFNYLDEILNKGDYSKEYKDRIEHYSDGGKSVEIESKQ